MKKKLIVIPLLLILVAGGIFGGMKIVKYLPYYFDKTGKNQPDTEYTLTIEKSDFENEVATRLEQEGIIISAVRFLGYLNKNYPEFVWYNGKYKLTADMSYKELCEKLSNPDERIDYVKFTVPEGKKVTEIASIVEKAGICSAEEFLDAADSYDYNFRYMDELKARDNSKIAYKLEGYLFPATYEFRADTVSAKDVVAKMLGAFEDYVGKYEDEAKGMGLSINELVTFGAVIQAEAFSKESMANISSVFWNRLNSKDMRVLQSDPTTNYARDLRDNFKGYTKAMFDAYDTYTCIGLPVGPTNCPGTDVIEAVLHPNDTDYFYFVTDAEGNFYYNKTYKEHVNTCYKIGLWK